MKAEQTIYNKEDQTILKEWKRTRQIKNTTFKGYTSIIKHYTRATGMTLHELYNEAVTEEETGIPLRRRKIKHHILDFYDYLDQSNISENTKNNQVYVVKSFYRSLDIQIPEIPNNYDNTPNPKNTEKMITQDLIKLMMNQADIKEKAVINFITMTGQSPNEVCHITIRDIVDCWNHELENKVFDIPDIFKYKQEILKLECPPMRIKRLKTNNHYWFYIPRETSKYLLEYIYHRVAGRNKKLRIHSIDDPLFVNKMGQPYTSDAMSKIFTSVGRKCGFETPELFDNQTRYLLTREQGNQRVYCAYKFRKYFLNMCRRYAGTRPETDSDNVYQGKELGDFWIGHQEKGSISHYLQYNDEDVLELQQHYLQMLPYLSVETEVEVVTSKDKEEFNMMKQKYEDMVHEMEELREYVKQKQRLNTLAHEYGLE